METIAVFAPGFLLAFLAIMMALIGGTVQVVNPKRNPKRKGKKRKKTGKKRKKRRSAAQKAASKRNIKKAQAARRKKGKKGKSKKRKKRRKNPKKKAKKKSTKKKAKKRRKYKRRKTVTITRTYKNPKKRRKRKYKKRRKNPKRRAKKRRKSNPKFMTKVKKAMPKVKGVGKVTIADGAGVISGAFVGTSLSGLTKMATGKPIAGVAVHGFSWIGGSMIIKAGPFGKKKKAREHFARGWFVGDGVMFGVDASLTLFRYLTASPAIELTLSDVESADWLDKIKTVFLTGLGHPEEYISQLELPSLSGARGEETWGLADGDLVDDQKVEAILDELSHANDLTSEEQAMLAEVQTLYDYTSPMRENAAEEFV